MNHLRLVSVLLLMVASGGITGVSASAEPRDAAFELIRSDLNEAELVDLGRMAEQDGISLDEAISSFGWQQPFASLANDLQQQYPADYAGAGIDDAAGRRAWIAFKNEVPADAARQILAFEKASIDVRADRGFSVPQLDERIAQVHRSISARSDLVKGVTSYYSADLRSIVVEVQPVEPKAATDATLRDELRRTLLDSLTTTQRAWGVDIFIRASITAGGTADVYGGGRLEYKGGDSLKCTGGFSVYADGVRRMLTAGHCTVDDMSYSHGISSPEYGTNAGREHRGSLGRPAILRCRGCDRAG